MCRIDAPFGNRALDEKKDPVERFLQALDEFEVQGNFRTLLIKHFSEHWIEIFCNSSRLEEALTTANKQESEPEKCIALAFYQNVNLRFRLQPFHDEDFSKESRLFNFLTEVATTYFPTSPYGFYKAGIAKHFSSYARFINNHYGEEFFFTNEFLNDEALSSLNKNERMRILWDCLYFIAPPFESLEYNLNDSTLINGLLSLASSNDDSSSPCEHAQSIQLGLEFLSVWIKHDAEAGRISCDLSSFFWGTPWEKLESLIWKKNFDDEDINNSITNWLESIKRDFEKVIVLSFDVDNIENSKAKEWADLIERYFSDVYRHIQSDIDWNTYDHDKFDIRLKKELEDLCSQLTPKQLETWIQWSLQQDFERCLSSKNCWSTLSISSERWVSEALFNVWEKLFLTRLDKLDFKDQLHILSTTCPARRGESYEFSSNCYEWWRELFRTLPNRDGFPQTLLPEWTAAAIHCLHGEELLPYIDKSVGMLRGEISKSQEAEIPPRLSKQLKVLLDKLDKLQPQKSFRHRMLLTRAYRSSIADNTVSLPDRSSNTSSIQWYEPIDNLAHRLFNSDEVISFDETPEIRLKKTSQPYETCTYELAKFCLSRLRLLKGEKARDKQYTTEQVVEQSSIWRQGYLKALTELGVDLNGKVHKAVYFIKQSDPDPDVRAIASECYKAVRRNTKKNPTIADLKRGIIAAEWWLLICQRQNLGMKINPEDALKTRRNLMRNP